MGKRQAMFVGIVSLLLIVRSSLCSLSDTLGSNLSTCSESGASLVHLNPLPPLAVLLPAEILDHAPWLLVLPLNVSISTTPFSPYLENHRQ